MPNNVDTGLCYKNCPFFFFLIFLLPILEAVASLPDLTKLLAIPFSSWGISFPLGCDRTKQRAKFKNWKNKWEKIPSLTLTMSKSLSLGVEIPQAKVTRGWENIVKQQHYTPFCSLGTLAVAHGVTAQVGLCSWLTCLSL